MNITEITAYQNRPFPGTVQFLQPNGGLALALPSTYELNFFRMNTTTPFVTATVGNGKLTNTQTADLSQIDWLLPFGDLANVEGYGSAELKDTVSGRVITVIPIRFVKEGTPYAPEYSARLVVYAEKVVCVASSHVTAALSIDNDFIVNAMLDNMPANSVKGNITGATDNPQDIPRNAFVSWLALVGIEVANTPAGGISATTVQAALNELDNEKFDKAGGTISGNVVINGDLTLNGTTTTINSTTVTYDDIILVVGGDTVPVADDAKDRGLEFRWHNGSAAKIGFLGFDRSTGELAFVPDATDTAGVISGTDGTFRGSLNGNAATASKWATGRTITLTGDVTGVSAAFDGSGNLTIATTLGAEAVQDVIGALFITSGEFTYTYNDAGNAFSVALTAASIANSKLANMATGRFKARVSGTTGDPEDITGTQATTLLDVATGSLKGLMTSADFTKLAGIAAGATVNSSDATLLARANHTGTQIASTISDFTEATQDVIGALFITSGEFTYTYNDAGNAFSVALTAASIANSKLANMATGRFKARISGTTGDPEDITGTQATTLLDVATGSLKGLMSSADFTKLGGIAAGATANSSDATLLNRANHTGTQIASTISDFTEATQDVIGALFITSGEFTYTYNDAGNAFSIALTAASVAYSKLFTIADKKLIANISGSTASPTENTLSDILDAVFGNTRGALIYRGASGWASLGYGAVNYVITGQGVGADPIWAAQSGGGGGGSPGGTNGQIQFNSSGAFGGFTVNGDGSLDTSTGALTVAKIGGKTVTLGGNLTISGAFTTTLNVGANTNVTLPASGTLLSDSVSATLSKGFKQTPNSLGNMTNFTIDPSLGQTQYGTNHGAVTITAPANDSVILLLITNDGSAGAITMSGFTVGSNTGDPFTTTNTHKFFVSIARINGVSSYWVKALQ